MSAPAVTVAALPTDLRLALIVGLGGALGALVRFGVASLVDVDRFPLSVVVVNALGTFLAALLAFEASNVEVALFASVGFCGSLTTFSTFSVRTVTLWTDDRPGAALLFGTGTLAACLLAVAAAWLTTAVL